MAGLLAVLGFAASTQVQVRGSDESFASYRQEDLLALVDGLDGSIARSRSELSRLRETGSELRADVRDDELLAARAEDRTAPLRIIAGAEPVTGPGLRMTIADPDGEVGFDLVVDLVQDLRTGGATAIELNDAVRVGGDTWFSGLGGGITADGTELGRPYVIDVVGPPISMAAQLAFPSGGADRIRREGGEIVYDQLDEVRVDSVRPLQPQPLTTPTGPVL